MGPLGEAAAGASDYVFTWEIEGGRASEREIFPWQKKVCLVNLLLQRGYYAFTL